MRFTLASQVFEEELFFPGKPVYPQAQTLIDLDVAVSSPLSSTTTITDLSSSSYSLTTSSFTSDHPSTDRYMAPTPAIIVPGSEELPIQMPIPLSSPQPYSPMNSSSHAFKVDYAEQILPPGPEMSPPPPPPPPVDPRDHSLLEFIYTEMHTSRFINLQPLSLLKNSLPLHFKGMHVFTISRLAHA
jgi:hypothetical protein